MRIVYLNPSGNLGGAERVLLNVLVAVRTLDPPIEAHLISMADGPLLAKAASLGVKVHLLPASEKVNSLGDSGLRGRGRIAKLWSMARGIASGLPAAWAYSRRLHRLLTSIKPDLIHSNGVKTHLLMGLFRKPPAPVVWHVHDFYGSRPAVGKLLKRCQSRVARAIAISQAVRVDSLRLFPDMPIDVILNTVDTNKFRPTEQADPTWLDELAELPATKSTVVRVGLVATYARWKGQALFIEAISLLEKQNSKQAACFYIIGGPVYRTKGSQYSKAELVELAILRGISDQLGFVDFQSDPQPVYAALDVVIHASTEPEPFGLTIVEAMACGKAVVAVNAGGAAELIRHGETAIGIATNDPSALAQAMQTLIENEELRVELGRTARKDVLIRFSQERLAGQLSLLYRSVLEAESH